MLEEVFEMRKKKVNTYMQRENAKNRSDANRPEQKTEKIVNDVF
jgi:hypothetical protein